MDTRFPEQCIEASEYNAKLLRMRKLGVIGLIAWVAFGLLDWFIVAILGSGRLAFFLSLRGLGAAALAMALLRISTRRRPSSAELRFIETSVLVFLSTIVSVSAIEFHGIVSPLILGVVTLIVARGALLSDHYKRALFPVAAATLAFPFTLFVAGFFSPKIAAQLTNPGALGLAGLNLLFLFGASALSLIGGHTLWAMQRKVFESRSFGRYKLLERIGQGGMGEVWIAHHRTLKRQVAVKILNPQKGMTKNALARFEREVQATAELSHPNTVRVFDYGVTDDDLCYYAMEHLEGRDLAQTIQQDGPMVPLRAIELMRQAAAALAEAHARGIIHRDIKPENLFVTRLASGDEAIKVLDFGLARINEHEGDESPQLTMEGYAVGTPTTIGPEVLFGKPADARTDVYALGCVLYFALTGRPPFVGKDLKEVLAGHRERKPPSLRALARSELPEIVETIALCCLEKDPGDRFSDARELAEALLEAERCIELDGYEAPAVAFSSQPGQQAIESKSDITQEQPIRLRARACLPAENKPRAVAPKPVAPKPVASGAPEADTRRLRGNGDFEDDSSPTVPTPISQLTTSETPTTRTSSLDATAGGDGAKPQRPEVDDRATVPYPRNDFGADKYPAGTLKALEVFGRSEESLRESAAATDPEDADTTIDTRPRNQPS
jgi:serine/threonine protein kinase